MKSLLFLGLWGLTALPAIAQTQPAMVTQDDSLPYRQIPDYPPEFTPENVAARLLDGLGFRYYWATEGLRPEDLDFRPSPEARNSFQTLQHIHGLSRMVLNSILREPNRGGDEEELDFEALRRATLENIQRASELLKSGEVKLEDCKIVFERGERRSEYPFWNALNGPIADALWHTGQVVSFRRSSGNPINPKVSVFLGRVRE